MSDCQTSMQSGDQGPGHLLSAQQGLWDSKTSLGDSRAADPTLENPYNTILFSEAERNGQTCLSFISPLR